MITQIQNVKEAIAKKQRSATGHRSWTNGRIPAREERSLLSRFIQVLTTVR